MPLLRRPHYAIPFRAIHRPAKAALALLLTLPVLLLAAVLAIYSAELVETRALLRDATDAAALAAVQTFLDDQLLLGDPDYMKELIVQARRNANTYAQYNLVFAAPLQLNGASAVNDPDSDFVVGTLALPRSKEFILPDFARPKNPEWLTINTVRITGRRLQDRGNPLMLHSGPLLAVLPNDAVAVSTATLDRDVVGFRPLGQQPMPLAPIALFSDPQGQLKHCWEFQVEKRRGPDANKIVRDGPHPRIAQGADGLHEMEPYLGTGKQMQAMMRASKTDLNQMLRQGKFSCCLLQFGTEEIADLAQQLISGIGPNHLAMFDGQLVLGANNQLRVPGTPWGPTANSHEGGLLRSALHQLQASAEPRVWPLFSSFDKGSSMPVLCGFVAARVVQVKKVSGKGGAITFSVQPCMMSTATAATDPARRGVGTARLPNPYLCKVRLVE